MPIYNPLTYNIGGDFFGQSPMGSSVKVNPKTGIVSGISPAVGDYVVTVFCDEYRNGIKLNTHYKEFLINVRNCIRPQAVLTPKPATCDGFVVRFENESVSPRNESYYWDFGVAGVTTDISTDATPTYTYPDTGVYIAKLIVNKAETCSDSATLVVSVFPGFFPGFNYDSTCITNPFVFKDISTTQYGVISYRRWDFGVLNTVADSSLLRNAPFKFPEVGGYTISLAVASSKGCIDTVAKTIQVLEKPALSASFIDTLICTVDTLQLRAIGAPTGMYSWTPTVNMIGANTATPFVFPKDTTTYTVTLTDLGCVATASVTVNTLDFITVDAGPDTTICFTDGVTLQPVTQALGFVWSPSATLSNAQIRNPVATPSSAFTTYTVLANVGKCQASDKVTIATIPYPTANAGTDTIICFGTMATLRGSMVGKSAVWSPASVLQNPTALATTATPVKTTNFVLKVYDDLGCPKPGIDTVLVLVRPPIKVFAGNDTSILIGQPLQLSGASNASLFNWSPSTGLSNASIANPVAIINSLPSGGFLTYTLTSSTVEGCNGADNIVLRVFTTAPSIFLPSAFTPNADGKNDSYKPILAGMRQLTYFRIYNRYGTLIFQTSEIGKGWDGKLKGQLQVSGAFVYNCQAIDYTGKTVKQSGSFILIR